MLPGEKFDEARLVKPEEWDRLADNDDTGLEELEAQMEADFAALKAEVTAEKAKAGAKSKVAKPIESAKVSEPVVTDLT